MASYRAARVLMQTAAVTLIAVTAVGGVLGAYDGGPMAGSYKWLASNWMFLHAGIGATAMLLLLMGTPSDLTKNIEKHVDWFCMILSSAYCSHQFEEHAYDIFGRRYPFIFHLAHLMSCNVELETSPYLTATGDCGLNEFVILWINVYGIFGAIICPLLLPERLKIPGLLVVSMLVGVNALAFHIIAAVAHGFQYNPGLVQSLFINAPLAAWIISKLYRGGHVSVRQILAAFLCIGLPGQPLLLLTPMVAQRHGKIGMATQHAFQFATVGVGLVPVIARLVAAVGAHDRKAHAK